MPENNHDQPTDNVGSVVRNPDEWITGTQPITDKQEAQLKTLAGEAHEAIPEDLSGAGAHIAIEALKQQKESE